MPMPELFDRSCTLALALGFQSIHKLPGCCEINVDEHWWFAINPHTERTDTRNGFSVPPMSIVFTFNDWPAGVVDFHGGMICVGEENNEDALIAALDAAICRLMPEPV